MLYVVTAISNIQGYKSRYKLYENFSKYLDKFENVTLYTVELAYRGAPFVVTQADNPHHVQIRGDQPFWHKENLLNIGFKHLPPEAKYVAWLDADIEFLDPNWAENTINLLDKTPVIQMFSRCRDLGPSDEVLYEVPSFMAYLPDLRDNLFRDRSKLRIHRPSSQGKVLHNLEYTSLLPPAALQPNPGMAWAARRDFLDQIGGLIDWCVISPGDWHMACCFAELINTFIDRKICYSHKLSQGYQNRLREHQARCSALLDAPAGMLEGRIAHHWHGSRVNRGYGPHWDILLNNDFDPDLDLTLDSHGLYRVRPFREKLLQDVLDNLNGRQEDSTSLT